MKFSDFTYKRPSVETFKNSFIKELQSFHNAETFEAQKEAEIYHACRDWFMEQYDGFITVEKIDNFQEDSEFFKDFKNRMKQEGYLKVTVRNPDREL